MVFKTRAENGGEVDKNINTKGRIKADREFTNRELRQRELLSLVRKLKPTVAIAVNEAAKILGNKEAADANKLRASALILMHYRDLVKDIYDGADDDTGDEIQQNNAPVFSLKVLRNPEDITDVETK